MKQRHKHQLARPNSGNTSVRIRLRRSCGFTLIEMMIVVAIIAILAAIAYPSYTEQVARGRRADAKAALLETAQWLERRFSVQNTYLDATLPPLSSAVSSHYTVGFASGASAPTADTYWLQMTPQSAMAADKCGTFIVNQAGARRLSGQTSGTIATCWDK